jgi:putative hydrolase of HD superfamily
MPRAHKRNLWTAFDTIASHSYHVAMISYMICKMEWLSDEDAQKATTMGVFHDLAEARTWDHDFVAKKYNDCNEDKAIRDFTTWVPWWESIQQLMNEYEHRESLVSKCTKDADQLAQIYHERTLMRQWNKLAQQRFEWSKEKRIPYMHTESWKQIALQMFDSELNPNSRRREEFVTNDYNQDDLVR